MRIIFFDTETTGGGPTDRLLQLAAKERGVAEPVVDAMYSPPVPISLESMTVHHITKKMVADKPAFLAATEYAAIKELFESGDTVVVAHNASFDLAMLAREDISPKNVICTYKSARALDPEEKIGKYQLQYLRYLLEIEVDAVAHSAMGDVLVLEAVFERLLAKAVEERGSEEAALQYLQKVSAEPILFTTMRFGKYRGKNIADIVKSDRGYLEWLLAEKKKDPYSEADWIYSLEFHLKPTVEEQPF